LLIADQSLAQAEQAAARVNQLSGRPVAHPIQVEVQNEDAVVSMLTGAAIEVLISGVPYFYNLGLTRAAIRAHTSMCDFGGNTKQVRQELAFDLEARAAGITLIPDCGQVPFYVRILYNYVGGQNEQWCANFSPEIGVGCLVQPIFAFRTDCLLTQILVKIVNNPPIS
jgi:saccharopine dehydrogenase-like NADP-dependent oxidoreductase